MAKKEETKVKAQPKKEAAVETPIVELDKTKTYKLEEAVKLVKELSKVKFDASVELHMRLGIDPKKGDQQVRSAVSLPHGTGKTIKVAAFVSPEKEKAVKDAGADYVGGIDLIDEIKKSEKTDFQVAVAEPTMMKDLSKIAKILGTRGLMPSPKNDTVTITPEEAVAELKKGKISFKNDDTANIHAVVGKVSFEDKQLLENLETVMEAIKKSKPSGSKGIYIRSITLTSSMGPGVKITLVD